jgi:hypothetical protein
LQADWAVSYSAQRSCGDPWRVGLPCRMRRSVRLTPMSRPDQRTALRSATGATRRPVRRRCWSRSPARCRSCASAPGSPRDGPRARGCCSSGASWRSSASIMASATSIRSQAASGSSGLARPLGRRRPPHVAPRTRTPSPCKPPPPRPARPGGGRPSAAPPRVRSMRAAMDLARLPVESVEGDLRSVHVEPGYDRHWAFSEAPALPLRASAAP